MWLSEMGPRRPRRFARRTELSRQPPSPGPWIVKWRSVTFCAPVTRDDRLRRRITGGAWITARDPGPTKRQPVLAGRDRHLLDVRAGADLDLGARRGGGDGAWMVVNRAFGQSARRRRRSVSPGRSSSPRPGRRRGWRRRRRTTKGSCRAGRELAASGSEGSWGPGRAGRCRRGTGWAGPRGRRRPASSVRTTAAEQAAGRRRPSIETSVRASGAMRAGVRTGLVVRGCGPGHVRIANGPP